MGLCDGGEEVGVRVGFADGREKSMDLVWVEGRNQMMRVLLDSSEGVEVMREVKVEVRRGGDGGEGGKEE